MKGERKTKAQLIEELADLRRQLGADNVPGLVRRLAVERVRAEAMAMRTSDDLTKVVPVLHQGLKRQGVRTPATSIQVLDEGTGALWVNATKFTAAGSITLSLRAVDGAAQLSVADTGLGIPADDLPHIFDEFRQVQRQGGEATEGTGLGRAIAEKTVDLLGGTITAHREVGVGTTFTLRIGDAPSAGAGAVTPVQCAP